MAPHALATTMPPKKAVKEDEKEVEGVNSGLFQRVEAALKVIDAHEWFRNAKEEEPIGLPAGAPQDRAKTAKKAKTTKHPPLVGTQAGFDSEAFALLVLTWRPY